MQRIFFGRILFSAALCSILAVLLGCTPAKEHGVASLDAAQERVIEELYRGELGDRALFAASEPRVAGSKIATWRESETVSVRETSWFFFVDETPGANWEHPAKLILVEERTGKIWAYEVLTPPSDLHELQARSAIAKQQMEVIRQLRESVLDDQLYREFDQFDLKQQRYAMLVSGGWNASSNYSRYWNDLSSIYQALKDKYGYTDNQIIVLYANGTHSPDEDLDGDGTGDIDFAATKVNLTTAMQLVANGIAANGKFFFYATNHGGHEGGYDATLYLWGETIRDDEFAPLTANIKAANAIYVMEQCFSGGMMDDILTAQTYPCTNPRVCVMTAAKHDEVSWSADTEGAYDEYVYHWTAAVHGQTPTGTAVNADSNGDGVVSMSEAHEYAKGQDSRNEHPVIGSCVTNACGTSLAFP